MFGEFGPWHWLIVAVIAVVLFGSRRLPDAARAVGRSMRIFKSEIRGLREDDASVPPAGVSRTVDAQPSPAPPPPAPAAAPAPAPAAPMASVPAAEQAPAGTVPSGPAAPGTEQRVEAPHANAE